MQSVLAAGAVLATVINSVAAVSAPAAAPEGVLQFDIHHVRQNPRIRRRVVGTAQETLMNNYTDGGYFMKAQIGTPPQNFTVLVDTGSSDFWVPDASASICTATRKSDGCDLGSFDITQSSTAEVVDEATFNISYVDESGASGIYFNDTLWLNDYTLLDFTFGLGQDTTVAFGIAGVGFTIREAVEDVDDTDGTFTYANLPVNLKDSGIIKSIAYSLWLNDLDASTGSILFGGVDSSKYTGHLTMVDMVGNGVNGEIVDFRVPLTSVTATSSTGEDTLTSADYFIPAVLDSGTSLAYLPQSLAEQVWAEAGAIYEANVESAVIPCSRATSGGKFTFTFGGTGGASITVGMDELVLDKGLGPKAYFMDGIYKGQDACTFGLQNQSEPVDGEDYLILLGDTFLRSAYVVYDLENLQVGMAQTDFNATDSNIKAFASEGATIPDATAAPSQTPLTSATGTAVTPTTYKAASGFSLTATATATSTSTSTPKKSSAGTMTVPAGLLHVGAISAIMFVAGGMLML